MTGATGPARAEDRGADGPRNASDITVLRCRDDRCATKRWFMQDGQPIKEDFNAGTWFDAEIRHCGNIDDLHDLLTEMESDPRAFVIRGIPAEGVDLSKAVRRKKLPDKRGQVWFCERDGGQPWLSLDFDKVALPAPVDLISAPESAIRQLIGLLPKYFHDVTCHWQLSSSAGMTRDNRVVYARLWFWLNRSAVDAELMAWSKQIDAPIDASLFQIQQPHYVAGPIFDGLPDPLPRRSGLLEGSRHHVEFPDIDSAHTGTKNGHDMDWPGDGPESVLDGVPEGERDKVLFRYASSLRARGLPRAEAEVLVLAAAAACSPPFPPDEAREKVASAWGYAGPETDGRSEPLIDLVMPASGLLALDLPEREYIIEPFIRTRSLNMEYAKRGTGKTWLALSKAISVARGTDFLCYKVPKARRVLFVDGEMPLADLQERLRLLCGDNPPERLELLASETLWLKGQALRINDPEHQARILDLLDELEERGRAPELIIFDNLSSLTAGMDENSNSDLDDLLQWLIGLRHRGLAVLLVHHAGKGGDQRGASRREDLLDTSIKLEEDTRGPDEAPALGAAFKMTFAKVRGARPQPDILKLELREGKNGLLDWAIDASARGSKGLELLWAIHDAAGSLKTQKELGEAMGLSKGQISKLVGKARADGLLEQGRLALTPEGRAQVDPGY